MAHNDQILAAVAPPVGRPARREERRPEPRTRRPHTEPRPGEPLPGGPAPGGPLPSAPEPHPATRAPREHFAGNMPIMENLRVAMQGLAANKLRAALTMLGIIIGVAAVIAMVALGQGASARTLAQIQKLGTNLLLVEADRSTVGAVRGAAGTWDRVKMEDIEAINADNAPAVLNVSPEIRRGAQLKAGNKNTGTNIFGVWSNWIDIRNYKMAQGRFLTPDEVKKKAKVAVLGWTVYQQLYPDGGDPTGKLIRINGVGVRCIGVLAAKGQSGNMDNDDVVVVPASTAEKRLFNWARVRSFAVQAVSEDKMDQAAQQIDAIFRQRYRVKESDPSTIVIRNQSEIASFAQESQNTFTALLAGIAGVSLLVGGIGIMNIMLVSVTERTREIGIRKAIGAKRRDVMAQFLIEAVVLSLMGGIVGIALGFGIAKLLPMFLKESSTVISLAPMILAFGFSAAVGIFFGFYPAQKASKLDPIVALRYE